MRACKHFGSQCTPLAFGKGGTIAHNPQVADVFPRTFTSDILLPTKKKRRSKKRVAVLFSGGPASGGHNVLIGLKDMLKGSTLFGVRNGPYGLLKGDLFEIDNLAHIKDTGGFDYLGTDRTKIRTPEQIVLVKHVCETYGLDALVIIGGDDSNTNAALLAEHLENVQVIGVPKTMDGDLQVDGLNPIPFGFDTATKIYGELTGNICKDALSSRKYWHFVRLMGRDASHVTLEVALQTQPTYTLLTEELSWEKKSLKELVNDLARCIEHRAMSGKEYGVVLVPEGLLQALPDFQQLLDELGKIMQQYGKSLDKRNLKRRKDFLAMKLSSKNRALFTSLPDSTQQLLSLQRDQHGNVNLSKLNTEELLAEMVSHTLKKDVPFQFVTHFFGYEGRCGRPSLFDAWLTYNLGLTAGALVLDGRTGYMAGLRKLDKGGEPIGIPLAALLTESSKSHDQEFVIAKRLLRESDLAYQFFKKHRNAWSQDAFMHPDPRQFSGADAKKIPRTVMLNNGYGASFK